MLYLLSGVLTLFPLPLDHAQVQVLAVWELKSWDAANASREILNKTLSQIRESVLVENGLEELPTLQE